MKNKIIIIGSSVIAIMILLIAFLYINNQNQTKTDGLIHLYVTVYDNGIIKEIMDEDVSFYENEYLIDVLKRHLQIEEGKGSEQGMIVGINNFVANSTTESYYKIIVNCEWAQTGAWNLSLNDNDSIRITYSTYSDWSTGC